MNLFVYAHLDTPSHELIRQRVPAAIIVDKHKAGVAERRLFETCDICFGNVPADWISGATALRWLQLESVGSEYYRGISAAMTARRIVMTNLKGMFAEPAAETALAGLLALYRGIADLIRAQDEQKWIATAMRERLGVIAGRRALVLGFGSIGRRIRDLLVAFGCEVSTFARTSPAADYHSIAAWEAAIGTFDIVVNALPDTPATRGILSAERIACLAPDAIVVNVGRGSAVDQPALLAALQSGRLGGAVLDVYSEEPLPPGHPLWQAPRTIITQHTGGGSAHELVDKTRFFLDNLARYGAGEPLLNLVDPEQGY